MCMCFRNVQSFFSLHPDFQQQLRAAQGGAVGHVAQVWALLHKFMFATSDETLHLQNLLQEQPHNVIQAAPASDSLERYALSRWEVCIVCCTDAEDPAYWAVTACMSAFKALPCAHTNALYYPHMQSLKLLHSGSQARSCYQALQLQDLC